MKDNNSSEVEIWKPLYNYEHYRISNHGRILSLARNIFIGIRNGKHCYRFKPDHICSLRTNKIEPFYFCSIAVPFLDGSTKSVSIYIHRATADHFTFKPSRLKKLEKEGGHLYASHIVKDYSNNRHDNLKFISHKELIQSQPKRLADPTKGWRTRKSMYGKSGNKQKNIIDESTD